MLLDGQTECACGTVMTLAKPLELCITEEWIKERLDIHADTLGKLSKRRWGHVCGLLCPSVSVRSLLLPGTYHQKITHLGRSLLSFSRLKHLDLSRNALESLKVRETTLHMSSHSFLS